MWLKLTNGRVELVINEDHIKRLISEGAVEIPDPQVPLISEAVPEESTAASSDTDRVPPESTDAQQSSQASRKARSAK